MRRWLTNLEYRIKSSMYGRYGIDEFSKFLILTAIIVMFINLFVQSIILYLLEMMELFYSLFRTYSKNIYKRQKERDFYLKHSGKIKGWFRIRKRIWKERKYNKYFRCPKCKAYLHVPKNRGKIIITCPGCKTEINGKS